VSNELSPFVTHVRHNQTYNQWMTSRKEPSTENHTHCERECNRVDCISHYGTKTRIQKYQSLGNKTSPINRATLRFANSPYYVHETTPSHLSFELIGNICGTVSLWLGISGIGVITCIARPFATCCLPVIRKLTQLTQRYRISINALTHSFETYRTLLSAA